MQRDEILAEMKRTAEENGGKPLGRGRFERVTGIGRYDWLKYWSRFGDIQRDAGLEPNQLQAAYDDTYLFEKIIELTRELRKYPTLNEMQTKAFSDPDFPHPRAFTRLGNKSQLMAQLLAYCTDKPQYADVTKLVEPPAEVKQSDDARSDIGPTHGKSTYGFVYLVKGHPVSTRSVTLNW